MVDLSRPTPQNSVRSDCPHSTVHGMAQKTDLRAVQQYMYEKKGPNIPQAQILKSSRKKSVKSFMK